MQKIVRFIFHLKLLSFTAFMQKLPSTEKIIGGPYLLYSAPMQKLQFHLEAHNA